MNRRDYLKATGVTGFSLATIGSNVAAQGNSPEVNVHSNGAVTLKIKRSFKNSLPVEALKGLQQRAFKKAAKINESAPDVSEAPVVPKLSSDLKVVAFLHHIQPNGEYATYLGAVPDMEMVPKSDEVSGTSEQIKAPSQPEVVQKKHASLDEFESETLSQNNDVTTQSTDWGRFSVPDSFSKKAKVDFDVGSCPYGIVKEETRIYLDTASDQPAAFGAATRIDLIPGTNQCGTNYKRDWMDYRQGWQDYNTYANGTVEDYGPQQSSSGDITGASFSVGPGSVGIGFSWDQPNVSVSNNNNEEQASWNLGFNDNVSDTIQVEFASYAEFDESASYGDKLMDSEIDNNYDYYGDYGGKTYSTEKTLKY